jgi:hypothetical protein
MALDRNIYWVGRQWAVTGLGIQLVDQRLKGAFDIEASRVWAEDVPERMRAYAWLNAEDFDKALSVARERFPAPPKKRLPLVESVLELIQPALAEEPKPVAPAPVAAAPARESVPVEPPAPVVHTAPTLAPMAAAPAARETVPAEPPASVVRAAPALALQIDHASAKFLPQWKIRAQGWNAQQR